MLNRPLWGDLHNHNAVGYGRGAMDRSFAIARGGLLDFYCFTPHGIWHDTPANDPKMVEFHRVGFGRVRDEWPAVKQATERYHEPGRFVTLHGYEWHSSGFGDYHMIFPGVPDELFAGNDVADLQALCRRAGAIMIPHHTGYRAGWRGANWPRLDPAVSPIADVFSEHGCSMHAEFNSPMLLHSMGGAERSQTTFEQLKGGRRVGVIASTDNHFGHPASYNEGLAAVWADEVSRAGVFDALRRRHTYALTGDRIVAALHCGEAMMGDTLPAGGPSEVRYRVEALGEIDYVRLFKNGRPVHDAPHVAPTPAADRRFVVRLDFGWDAMTSAEVTDWAITLRLDDGEIAEAAPCFAGGGGSVEKLNSVKTCSPSELTLTAFTSRQNSRPTSGLALRINGEPATRIDVAFEAVWKGQRCGGRLSARIGELLERDAWAAISEVFSSPKIRLGQAHGQSELLRQGGWIDPAPRPGDWYLLKALQANGQAAWTSPIWRS